MRFTDRTIQALKPKDKRYITWEDSPHGLGTLGIRVSPTGRKSWVFMYSHMLKARMITLGRYPNFTVAQAHAKAGEMMASVEVGDSPANEELRKKREKRKEPTTKDLAEDYIKRYAMKHKKTWKNDQQVLVRDVLPDLGCLKASEVRRSDIITVVEKIAARAPVSANRTLGIIRRMYNWAVENEIVENSPAWQVKNPGKEQSRDRVLTNDEIALIWKVLGFDRKSNTNLPDSWPSEPVRLALKLALVTAQRREEVAGSRLKEFDTEQGWWTIPKERTKTKLVPHRVPLTNIAKDLIERISAAYEQDEWLLPSPRNNGPVQSRALTHAVTQIRDYMMSTDKYCIDHWTLHDFRRTASSRMAAVKTPRLIISKILNHTEGGVTQIYDRYGYEQEKIDALVSWEQALRQIIN